MDGARTNIAYNCLERNIRNGDFMSSFSSLIFFNFHHFPSKVVLFHFFFGNKLVDITFKISF